MKSRVVGKLTTVMQFGFFFGVLCESPVLEVIFLVLAVVVSLLAAADYFATYQQRRRQERDDQPHALAKNGAK